MLGRVQEDLGKRKIPIFQWVGLVVSSATVWKYRLAAAAPERTGQGPHSVRCDPQIMRCVAGRPPFTIVLVLSYECASCVNSLAAVKTLFEIKTCPDGQSVNYSARIAVAENGGLVLVRKHVITSTR